MVTTPEQPRTVERTRNVADPALVFTQDRCAREVAGATHSQLMNRCSRKHTMTTVTNLVSQNLISPRRSPDTTRLLLAENTVLNDCGAVIAI